MAITRGEGRLLSVVAEASVCALRTLHDCLFLLACDDVLIILTPHKPYCWLRNAKFSGVKAPTPDTACNASIAWTKNRKIATSVAIDEDRLNFMGALEFVEEDRLNRNFGSPFEEAYSNLKKKRTVASVCQACRSPSFSFY